MDTNGRVIAVPLGTRLAKGQAWLGHDARGGQAALRRQRQQEARGLQWCPSCEAWLPRENFDAAKPEAVHKIICLECLAML
jgi:hypothetical protein